ncbi:MLO-like protein 9 isoform X1 [Syzygium oleosum]|uniref:MLO-like protein 9 isoform X1 n=1 Tax=Syzygium oleosum TaxID=219896 RepID=UPI0011D20194|nr:MLO-like protein 9 isoform X1 [Syzygium oleosum]XP_056164554.1 MLO-like protein 9 isoform X1 [Syzygium oleosum]
MAGGGATAGSRELDQTPTWAVSAVCAGIVLISILLEKVLHSVGTIFRKKRKAAMLEALEKLKGELMVLGFISLLLTFGQNYIAKVCIPEHAADTMLPCPLAHSSQYGDNEAGEKGGGGGEVAEAGGGGDSGGEHHRRLLWYVHRILAADSGGAGCKAGYVSMVSVNALHQLHIFIFFLAVFHVLYSAVTMTLGRLKIRGWKVWERETMTDFEFLNDPSRFRLTHETSFVREHSHLGNKTPFLFYIVCFFRQFFRAVRRADYLTMRHGFVTVHLAPGSKFDFQKYIKRSLEDDFKVVVGISPPLWASVVIFLLMNVHGWQAMFWLSILPVVVILAVGTKLQSIITQMALEIQERHAVVQGIPLVQVSDRHFWFGWPQLVLYLIHFVLFQNAFEITYFFWIWYEFGLKSCFHDNFTLVVIRVALGVGVQILCSYSTLPLYALVTQMGSTMKRSIFDEQTSKALKQWHKNALKKKTDGKAEPQTRTLGGSPGDSPEHSPTHAHQTHPRKIRPSDNDTRSLDTNAASITASVDVPGERNPQNNEKGFPFRQQDLLSSP